MTTVAVGVPCFNAGRYMEAVLESLLRQSRLPDAIMVVDDGSTDGSAAIVERFPEVRLLRHEGNRGLSQARNTLIDACQQDILVMIDSDAPADRFLVERLIEGYTGEAIAGVGGRAIEVHRRGTADRWRGNHNFAQHWGDSDAERVPFLYGLVCSYRVRCLREIGGFNTSFRTNGEDVEIGARLRQRGYHLAYRWHAMVYHQREDDVRSLLRMAERYAYGGSSALLPHGEAGGWMLIRDCLEALVSNLRRDLRDLPDVRPMLLSFAAAWHHFRGHLRAYREWRARRARP